MIKFYAQERTSGSTITRVEVARETDMFVVLEGQYRNRPGKWTHREKKEGAYFDTWKEAHEFILRQAEHRMDKAYEEYMAADRSFAKVQAMKEDDTQ